MEVGEETTMEDGDRKKIKVWDNGLRLKMEVGEENKMEIGDEEKIEVWEEKKIEVEMKKRRLEMRRNRDWRLEMIGKK